MSKQFGPLTQWAYLAQAADCQDSNPAKALAYIGKADSLCVNQTYSVSFPAKNPGNLGNDFARFYSQEFYYYMRFITSNIKLSIYHNLYKSRGGTSKYKTKYFNLAVTEYFKIGDELLVMFSDPKLKRPFTRDYQWSEHHK